MKRVTLRASTLISRFESAVPPRSQSEVLDWHQWFLRLLTLQRGIHLRSRR
jgi:hypothetical protein